MDNFFDGGNLRYAQAATDRKNYPFLNYQLSIKS